MKKSSGWSLKSLTGRMAEYPLKPEDYAWAEELALHNELKTISRGLQVVIQTDGEPVEVDFRLIRGGEYRGYANIDIADAPDDDYSETPRSTYHFDKPREFRHLESFQNFK